jgi:formiminoglutamase
MTAEWLSIRRGAAPLLIAIPHAGVAIPDDLVGDFVSPWLARKDADWWIDRLYAFAAELDATIVSTSMSRAVTDVNRDPSGASLYPGQATTELCPTTTFDGEPLYRDGRAPDDAAIAERTARWFAPYHGAIECELARLRAIHDRVVLYDAHSIRSRIARLFDGELPQFNIGTNGGTTCAAALRDRVAAICAASGQSHVVDGRFRGGWTTRHYGRPADGVHAIQMELATRGYLDEPAEVTPATWPAPIAPQADALRAVLHRILQDCIDWTRNPEA